MGKRHVYSLFGLGLLVVILSLVLSTGVVFAHGGSGAQAQGTTQMQRGQGAGMAAMDMTTMAHGDEEMAPMQMGAGQGRMAMRGQSMRGQSMRGQGMMRHGAMATSQATGEEAADVEDDDAAEHEECPCAQSGQAHRHGAGNPEECPCHDECPHHAEDSEH
jgi:hypothetical protein